MHDLGCLLVRLAGPAFDVKVIATRDAHVAVGAKVLAEEEVPGWGALFLSAYHALILPQIGLGMANLKWFNLPVPAPLELCPFIVALQVRHGGRGGQKGEGGQGGAVLVNPGTSLLVTPGLPRTMSFVVAFSLVVRGPEAGRHRIRLEVIGPGDKTAGSNEDDYWVPEAWKAESERARLVTMPVEVELSAYGAYEFRLLLDGRTVRPAWPLWVAGGAAAKGGSAAVV